jgi:hypothetical protein
MSAPEVGGRSDSPIVSEWRRGARINSGGNNRATARSLNTLPYRAISSAPRPLRLQSYRGDNYSDVGGRSPRRPGLNRFRIQVGEDLLDYPDILDAGGQVPRPPRCGSCPCLPTRAFTLPPNRAFTASASCGAKRSPRPPVCRPTTKLVHAGTTHLESVMIRYRTLICTFQTDPFRYQKQL